MLGGTTHRIIQETLKFNSDKFISYFDPGIFNIIEDKLNIVTLWPVKVITACKLSFSQFIKVDESSDFYNKIRHSNNNVEWYFKHL